MPDIAALLADSVSAHMRYRAASNRGERIPARAAMAEAFNLRAQALAADPDRKDPAWQQHEGASPHEPLMAFYAQQLS